MIQVTVTVIVVQCLFAVGVSYWPLPAFIAYALAGLLFTYLLSRNNGLSK
jgi:hypothetical protein